MTGADRSDHVPIVSTQQQLGNGVWSGEAEWFQSSNAAVSQVSSLILFIGCLLYQFLSISCLFEHSNERCYPVAHRESEFQMTHRS
jgi:hypothetical protein